MLHKDAEALEVWEHLSGDPQDGLNASYKRTQGFLASDYHKHFLAEKERRDRDVRAQLGGDKKLTQDELEDKLADLF